MVSEVNVGRLSIDRDNNGINFGWTNRKNDFGVRQGSQGDWMMGLVAELQQLQQWQFIHGTKTLEAVNKMIEFLQLKRSIKTIPIFKKNGNNTNQTSAANGANNGGNGGGDNSPNRKRAAIIAFIALAALVGISLVPQHCTGIADDVATQPNQIEMTQQGGGNGGNGGLTYTSARTMQNGQAVAGSQENWNGQNNLDNQRLNGYDNVTRQAGTGDYATLTNQAGDTIAMWSPGQVNQMRESVNRIVKQVLKEYVG